MASLRTCRPDERAAIAGVINAAAEAYRGIIPADHWHDPYMPTEGLDHEIAAGVSFWGYDEDRTLTGVMGLQPVREVDLRQGSATVSAAGSCGISGTRARGRCWSAHGQQQIGPFAFTNDMALCSCRRSVRIFCSQPI